MRHVVSDGQMSLAGDDFGMSGPQMMREAWAWRSRNLRAWSEMKVEAERMAAQGCRFSLDDVIAAARASVPSIAVNSSIRAALARILVKELPIVREYLEVRDSKTDWL